MKQVTAGFEGSSEARKISGEIERRCARIDWKLDPEAFMTATTTVGHPVSTALSSMTRLRDWLRIECHKSSTLKVLVIGNTLGIDLLNNLQPFVFGPSPYRSFERLTIVDISKEAVDTWRGSGSVRETSTEIAYQVWNPELESRPLPTDEGFDIIITGNSSTVGFVPDAIASFWKPQVRPGGRILILADHSLEAQESKTNGALHSEFMMRSIPLAEKLLTITSIPQETSLKHNGVCILVPGREEASSSVSILAENLELTLQARGFSVTESFLTEAESLGVPYVISLLDLTEGGFISNWTAEEFDYFKRLIDSATHLFWITKGGQMLESTEVGLKSTPTTGLLRVLRNEVPQIIISHVDLSPSYDINRPDSVDFIFNTWLSVAGEENQNRDQELAELENCLYVPRTLQEPGFNQEIALALGKAPAILPPYQMPDHCN
jgi:hypothetical protein